MKFVWEMDEENWNKFTDALDRKAFDVAYMAGEYLGCCRVGDLCFDIRAWSPGGWSGWGFELFCGGVDMGYGYSAKEAMETHPEYKRKYDVPNELLYPYDEAGSGDFPDGFETYTLPEFQKAAEKVFEDFIEEQSMIYTEADLVDKANEELHVW